MVEQIKKLIRRMDSRSGMVRKETGDELFGLFSTLEAENATLRKEKDEAQALFDACAIARDDAGFIGTVPECIEELDGETKLLTERLEASEAARLSAEAKLSARERDLVAAWNAFGPSSKRAELPPFDNDDLDHLPLSAAGDLAQQITMLEDRAEVADAKLAEAVKALEPFAAYIRLREECDDGWLDDVGVISYVDGLGRDRRVVELTFGDFRTAARLTNQDDRK